MKCERNLLHAPLLSQRSSFFTQYPKQRSKMRVARMRGANKQYLVCTRARDQVGPSHAHATPLEHFTTASTPGRFRGVSGDVLTIGGLAGLHGVGLHGPIATPASSAEHSDLELADGS